MELPEFLLCRICSSLGTQFSNDDLDSGEDFRPSDLWDQRPGSCWSLLAPLRLVCRGLRTMVDLTTKSTVTSLYVKLADISTDQLEWQLQAFPHLSLIRVEVQEEAPGGNLALVRTSPFVKELALVWSRATSRDQDAVCPPALLQALPSMVGLSTLWWCKTPSVDELEAMQQLPNLRCLQLDCHTISDLQALAGLTGLTLLKASLTEPSDITAVLQLTRLEKLDVHGGCASRNMLRKVLTEFPRLKHVSWDVLYDLDLDASVPPIGLGTAAASLVRLACSPVDRPACDPLQSLSFPLLQDLRATRDMDDIYHLGEFEGSLAWFPHMCRHAPSLTRLKLVPRNSNDEGRVRNVGCGISLLTNLVSLHLILRAFRNADPAFRGFVGAEPLAGLTRLTRLWVEGVVDPRFFDREVAALSKLTALRELLLFEMGYKLSENYTPSQEDGVITREALGSLLAALPNLSLFAVMGGWVDLGRLDWAGSLVTSQGRIVLRKSPWTFLNQQEEYMHGDKTKLELQNLRSLFGDRECEEAHYLILDVLLARHIQDAMAGLLALN